MADRAELRRTSLDPLNSGSIRHKVTTIGIIERNGDPVAVTRPFRDLAKGFDLLLTFPRGVLRELLSIDRSLFDERLKH